MPWMLRVGHMPPHPSFYARRDRLLDVGGFDTTFRISADFDQMVRLFLNRSVCFRPIKDTLSGFRDGGISTRNFDARRTINREIALSLAKNGVAARDWLLWARYPFKALQLVGTPRDYPAHLHEVGL